MDTDVGTDVGTDGAEVWGALDPQPLNATMANKVNNRNDGVCFFMVNLKSGRPNSCEARLPALRRESRHVGRRAASAEWFLAHDRIDRNSFARILTLSAKKL